MPAALSSLGAPPQSAARPMAEIGAEFATVLAAAQAGADWAWTLLYRSVAPGVRGFLAANGSHDPDNLLGEVFLQLARNLAGFEGGEAQFRAWVFTIARNRLRDEYRARRRRPVDPVADVPETAAEPDHLEGLLTAEAKALLDVLSPRQREVLLLRVFADLPLEDVAAIVGRPVTAVKSLQHRALTRLRKEMSTSPYPDGPVWR